MVEFGEIGEPEEKAAYNQARNISEILSNLLGSYIVYMNSKQYKEAIKSIRRIVDIISPKLKKPEIEKIDAGIKVIELKLPQAMQVYIHNGSSYIKFPELNMNVERAIEEVFRFVNLLQDKYGYGMLSMSDPRFAVVER